MSAPERVFRITWISGKAQDVRAVNKFELMARLLAMPWPQPGESGKQLWAGRGVRIESELGVVEEVVCQPF